MNVIAKLSIVISIISEHTGPFHTNEWINDDGAKTISSNRIIPHDICGKYSRAIVTRQKIYLMCALDLSQISVLKGCQTRKDKRGT